MSTATKNSWTLEVAEQQPRWPRRLIWLSAASVIIAMLIVFGHQPFIRWQLRTHGWDVEPTDGETNLPAWAPRWTHRMFGRIDVVYLSDAPVTFGDAKLLRRLDGVAGAIVDSSEITDPAMREIAQIPNLNYLEFWSVELKPGVIRHLVAANHLDALNLNDMMLDRHDIEALATCKNLRQLYLSGVTDDLLRPLSRLRRLRALGLINCKLSDDGWNRLAEEIPELTSLMITGVCLSEASLASLGRHPKLSSLQLSDMLISDEDILQLKSCGSLRYLTVERTRVTSGGGAELLKALPALKVTIR